jgi:hypothetical protein
VGGAQQLAKLNSFTAKGTYSGFDTDFKKVPAEIFGKAPNQRGTVNHLIGGDNSAAYDGSEGWVAASDKPLSPVVLDGGDLDGSRMDADVAFPTMLKKDLSNLHVGFPPVTLNGHAVQVVEGTAAGGTRVKLFFDKTTGLLVRQARLVNTVVGITPLHIDYSDYRLVPGSGVKMPFKIALTWTDGQSTTELTSVTPNAAVAAEKFVKPSTTTARITK